MAATAGCSDRLRLTCEIGLKWYRSSTSAARGFCASCDASIFWQGPHESYIAISAGALDDSTGLRIAAHIFVEDKAPYYHITDGLPQSLRSGHNIALPRG